MKVAIIGCGGIAWVHARAITQQPGVTIVGLADVNAQRARALGEAFGVGAIYTDAATMLADTHPDIVHVLTPPSLHVPVTLMAIAAGCHVLVEKPLAPTFAEAQALFTAASERGVLVCVDHTMLQEGIFQRAIALARAGVLGEIVSVDARFAYDVHRTPAIVERGAEGCHWSYALPGGLLQDLLPHPASLVFEFVTEITRTESVGLSHDRLCSSCCDQLTALVASRTVLGSIGISLVDQPDTVTLTLRGKGGTLHADLFSNLLTIQRRSGLPRAVARGVSGWQRATQSLTGSIRTTVDAFTGRLAKVDGLRQVIAKFYAAVGGRGALPVSQANALLVASLSDALWPPSQTLPEPNPAPSHSPGRRRPEALVTGATGFIGTFLIEKLVAERVPVRALVRPGSPHRGRLQRYPVEIVEGDLSDACAVNDAARDIRVVYHAGAAMTGPWDAHAAATVAGTKHIIEASLAARVERLVHLSTLAVYELASLRNGAVVREDSPSQRHADRMGPYAQAKVEAERILAEAQQRRGLPLTIVRPGIVIGPMSHGSVFFPHLGFRYQDKLFLIAGSGDTTLPLTYIENTVDAIYRAATIASALGQSYNIVDDGEISVREYLRRFLEVTRLPARVVRLPYAVPYALTMALEAASAVRLIRVPPTSRAQLRQKHVSIRFDCTKAKTELGVKEVVGLDEGIAKTFAWYAARFG